MGAGLVKKRLAEGMAVEDTVSVQRGRAASTTFPEMIIAPEDRARARACLMYAHAGGGEGEKASSPPLNALGSVSMVMSKADWRGGGPWIPSEQPTDFWESRKSPIQTSWSRISHALSHRISDP